jgi:DNA repair exonuclease SbcCD ATPase subunit
MFELARLKVQGFRGFVDEREFEFDAPVVILFGANGCGKSSTLNAVEWCLFGDECVGKRTGIPERLAWEISNRYVGEGRVAVETEFKGPDGTYVVSRETTGAGKRAAGTLTVTLPDGTRLHGEDANQRVNALFRSSFRDFMTTVYQHQESIRANLTDVPRNRNDAIDRLLGLSEYRELQRAIQDAGTEKAQKDMESDFEHLRTRVKDRVDWYEKEVREKRASAVAQDIQDEEIGEQEALRHAGEIGEALQSLARDLGIGDFQVAAPLSYDEIAQFREWVKDQPDNLWARAPDVAKQEELAKRQQELSILKGNYEAAKARAAKAQQEKDTFIREYGDKAALEKRVAEEQRQLSVTDERIREASKRERLVHEAIEYLRRAAPKTTVEKCPLCFSEVPDLLAHLEREWKEKLKDEVGELRTQRQEHASEGERLGSLRGQLVKMEKELNEARFDVEARVDQIGSALEREIRKEDDPGALITARLGEIAFELERTGQAIKEKMGKRIAIFDQVAKLRTVDEIIDHERKRAIVERIWETEEFRELDEIRDEAARFVEDVQAITSCLAVASREEAKGKIQAAGAALDEYFRRLTNRSDIPGLVMEVEDTRSGLNSYAFKSTDGTDPIPILNQGDFNCLALSLFLGLARATGDTQPFAFLMLDDPAQSLGSEAKRQLVDVLEDVATWRKLIIATPDDEFSELLETKITKSKAVYEFIDWSEKNGPEIARAT